MTEIVSIVGKVVSNVRAMTKKEMEAEGWAGLRNTIIEFEDGTKVFASRDEEGNGPGCLFGVDDKGGSFYIFG